MSVYKPDNLITFCNVIKFNKVEHLIVIMLDDDYNPVFSKLIKKGNKDEVNIKMGSIYKTVGKTGYSKYVLCHNHPGEDSMPSFFDDCITKAAKKDSFIFNLNLIDHIIVSDISNDYFSYKNTNWNDDFICMKKQKVLSEGT